MRPVQYFTPEYLEQCRQMTPEQILQFLEDFRVMFAAQVAEKNTHPIVATSENDCH